MEKLARGAASLAGADVDRDAERVAERRMSPLREQHPVATTVGQLAPYLAGPPVIGTGRAVAGAARAPQIPGKLGAAVRHPGTEAVTTGATYGAMSNLEEPGKQAFEDAWQSGAAYGGMRAITGAVPDQLNAPQKRLREWGQRKGMK